MPGVSQNRVVCCRGSHRLRRAVVATVSGALLVSMVPPASQAMAGTLMSQAAAEAAVTPTKVTERPDRISAALTARVQGSRVEVMSERTERASLFANPEGTYTSEMAAGPIRVRDGEGWAPIDTTLVPSGLGWMPNAAAGSLKIGEQGAVDFVASTARDHKDRPVGVGVGLASELPAPTISGSTAIFADVRPGADLVVTALAGGFSHDLVLKKPPASPLGSVRFPLTLTGLTASVTDAGGIVLADAEGEPVYTATQPLMWDARIDPVSQDPVDVRPVKVAIENKGGRSTLVLTPDQAFLESSATVYPVTIDPTFTIGASDTWIQYNDYLNSMSGSSELKAGTYNGVEKARSFLKFTLPSAFANSATAVDVTDAKLRMYNWYSGSCTGASIRAQRITSGDWVAGDITWANQPNGTNTGGGSIAAAYGYSSACSASGAYVNWDIDAVAQAWADGSPNWGLKIVAADETNTNSWRRYRSANYIAGAADVEPKLIVTYNSNPYTVTTRSTIPATACISGASRPWINTTTPTLQAVVSDPDGGTVYGNFDVWVTGGSASIWSANSTAVTSGGATSKQVPAAVLANGANYSWRVRGYDGALYSASWAPFCEFSVDTTLPIAPTIDSADWDEAQWSSPTSGALTWSSPSTDVTKWTWWLDSAAQTTVTSAITTATLSAVPPGWHTFHLKAIDRAGNSAQSDYQFGVGGGSLDTPADQDRTQADVPLTATAPTSRTHVSYRYRQGSTGAFVAIPNGDVTYPGTSTTVAAWPVARNGTTFPALDWELATSVRDAGGDDGLVQVEACFHSSSTDTNPACSPPNDVTLARTAFGASYATESIGPGGVSLLTGDFSVDATDVAVADLIIARSHTTLAPAPENSGPTGIFGPGWSAALPAAAGSAEYTLADSALDGYATLTGPDGETLVYETSSTAYPYTFAGLGDAADGTVLVKTSSNRYTLTDPEGTITTFDNASGEWVVQSVDAPGTEGTTSYSRGALGKVDRMIAPTSAGITCPGTGPINRGCRALDLTYAITTTATATSLGDYVGRLAEVKFTAWDPSSAQVVTASVARYRYDSDGRLRVTWDPRISPTLETGYTYDAAGRLLTLTPPGLNPWTMAYDTQGRLAHVTRTDPLNGPATRAVAYDVPLTANGLPDLSGQETALWGQTVDLPRTGAAAFPATRVPPRSGTTGEYQPSSADWAYAGLTYLDVNGRAVNKASYGAGAWQVSSSRHDPVGNVSWELSAGNRAEALTPGSGTDPFVAAQSPSAVRADLLATQTTHSESGEVLTVIGPTHPFALESGVVVSGRTQVTNRYDEGKPLDVPEDTDLVTTTVIEPVVLSGPAPSAADIRTNMTGYAPIDGLPLSHPTSGWKLRVPTSETTDMGAQADIVTKARYDESGHLVESRMPTSSGVDAATAITTYFTAAPGDAVCGNKPEFAGAVCRIQRAAQAGSVPLPSTTTSYDLYGQPSTVTETSGSVTRSTVTTYEGSRVSASSTTISGLPNAVPIGAQTFAYSTLSGLRTGVTTSGTTVATVYDATGRITGYTDADGIVTARGYDLDSRLRTLNDGEGTVTYSYDGTDAAGRAERRGLVTAADAGMASGPDVFTAAYDAAGRIATQGFSNGLTATTQYDNAGRVTRLTYDKGGITWLDFTQVTSAHGQVEAAHSPASDQQYDYDPAGRLSTVKDTQAGTCTTRSYGFTQNSNRDQYSSASGTAASCPAPPTPGAPEHTFDAADRITDSGYSYDELGRTLTVPADPGSGGQTVTALYHADDTVASLSQGTASKSYGLDPVRRLRSMTETLAGAETRRLVNHYADDGDAPSWIAESSDAGAGWTWSRNITGIGGDLTAIESSSGSATLQLANPHGDIVATVANDTMAIGVSSYRERTEFGLARADDTAPAARYEWLGAKRRSSDATGGILLMGARLYNPASGRFLSVDPVPDGNANAFVYPADPINQADLDGRQTYPKYGAYQCYRFNYYCKGQRRIFSATLGAAMLLKARKYGATCQSLWGMLTCYNAARWLYAQGGTTFGDTYITGSAAVWRSEARIRHEKEHRNQWRIFGAWFSILYAREGPFDPCHNYFEAKAGWTDGGYKYCF